VELLFPGQTPSLERWRDRPFAAGSGAPDVSHRRDAHVIDLGADARGGPGDLHRRAAEIVLAYRVFPPRVGTPVVARAPVEVGDVVGLRYRTAAGGLELFFASRVTERIDGEHDGWWRTGFTYRTLAGHPECGQETFAVETELATGRVQYAMRSFSRPGHWLSRAGAPVTRWLQVRANRAALRHVRAALRG
jgi:uncharacterized protein (UPF0548 family)